MVGLKSKIYLVDSTEEKFMGIGVLWLLQGVGKEKSLRAAAMKMEISYSKAFHMIKRLEEVLGLPVLDRHKGGSNRGGSDLTPFGREFMDLYDSFQKEAKASLEAPFGKFSGRLDALMEKYHGES